MYNTGNNKCLIETEAKEKLTKPKKNTKVSNEWDK